MEEGSRRKGVVVGGCTTGHGMLDRVADVLRKSGHVDPDKVRTFTLPQAMRQYESLEYASAGAFMILHGEGVLAVSNNMRPSVIVACNPPELVGNDAEGRRPRTFGETLRAVRSKHRHNLNMARHGYRPYREAYQDAVIDSVLQGVLRPIAYASRMRAIGRLSTRDHLCHYLSHQPSGRKVQVIAVVSPNDEYYPYREGDLNYSPIQVQIDTGGHDALLTAPDIVLGPVFNLVALQGRAD